MPKWNKWRSTDGRRPTVKNDGRGVPKEVEKRVYKEVMEMLTDPVIAKGVEERQRLAAAAGGDEEGQEDQEGEEAEEEALDAPASVPAESSKARGKGKGSATSGVTRGGGVGTSDVGEAGRGLAHGQSARPTAVEIPGNGGRPEGPPETRWKLIL